MSDPRAMGGFRAVLSLAPLTSRVCQRALGFRRLEEFASETVVLCGSEQEALRPAMFLPGEIERVHGVHEFSAGLRDEVRLATCGTADHSETVAYRLRDVVLASGCVCNFRSYRSLTFRRRPVRVEALTEVPESAALCSTDAGNDYFAHFVMDDICTALLGRSFGHVVFARAGAARTSHMNEYRAKLDVAHRDLSAAFFRDLWFFKDFPQNSHRRERLRAMRAVLRADTAMGPSAGKPAYIRRGASGSRRRLENESEIEALLLARGFVIVDPAMDSLAQIRTKLAGSPLVVGIEGSHLVHGLFHLADSGTLLCIQPAARFNAIFRGFANSVGLSWGFVVAEGGAAQFRLNADRLLATIDMALSRAGRC